MISTINNVKDPNIAMIAVLDKLVSNHENISRLILVLFLLEFTDNNKELHG